MSEDSTPDTHPDSPSGQPYSAPRQAWGGNADPRNLSYDGLRYFGPGYEQPNDEFGPNELAQTVSRARKTDAAHRRVLQGQPILTELELADIEHPTDSESGDAPYNADVWELRSRIDRLIADRAALAQARADGIEEGRGDMEHLERKWRAEERERGAPARYAAYEALVHAERRCRYHDPIGDKLGFERGLPRCESCQQPYRVNSALDAIDRYTRDTSGPADEG